MTTPRRVGSLELGGGDGADEHFGLQRLAWGLMLLLAVAALLGVFGNGWLSRAQAAAPGDALKLDYDRVLRADAPAQLRFTVIPGRGCGGAAHLTLPQDYLRDLQVEAIVPPPLRATAGSQGVTYSFAVPAGERAEVVFLVKPMRWGLRRGSAMLTGGPPLEFQQLVLP